MSDLNFCRKYLDHYAPENADQEIRDIRNRLREYHDSRGYGYFTPHVGRNYISDKHKKLLVVGESHYLCEGSELNANPDEWYDKLPRIENLLAMETGDIWNLWTESIGKQGSTCDWVINIADGLRQVLGIKKTEDAEVNHFVAFDEIAYCNFYVRPAEGFDKELKTKRKDEDEALKRMLKNIEILMPDIVFVSSKKAFDAMGGGSKRNPDPELYKEMVGKSLKGYCDGKYGAGRINFYNIEHAGRFWKSANKAYAEIFEKNGCKTNEDFFVKILKDFWLC